MYYRYRFLMNRLVVILFAGSLLSQSTNIDTILISNQDLSEKDFFKIIDGIKDIKFAFPHLSPSPLIVP